MSLRAFSRRDTPWAQSYSNRSREAHHDRRRVNFPSLPRGSRDKAGQLDARALLVSHVSSFIYFSTPIALLVGWLWLGERPVG
jgi:hypothetical protein